MKGNRLPHPAWIEFYAALSPFRLGVVWGNLSGSKEKEGG